jgi:hypothetical protein
MALVVLGACSSNPAPAGELIVAIDTDMSMPKDLDGLRIEVYQGGPGGTLVFGDTFQVPADEHVPATLAIVAGSNNTVDIRVLGILGNEVKVLREAVTTVPTDRQATLRMPVAWLCYGEVDDSTGVAQSSCPNNQTCIAGSCQTTTVNSSTLAAYEPQTIFGGAAAPGSAGTCFDTVACFAQGYVPRVDMTHCTVPAPVGAAVGINVGLVTSAGTGVGICGTDSCYIPLDYSDEGWQTAGSNLQLPQAVCDRLMNGQILSVVVTTSCETKNPSIPTCGAWSSVTSMAATVDAAAPDGAIPVIDAAPVVDAVAVPDVSAPDAGPQQFFVCPNVWIGVDTSACDPRGQTGCANGEACAVVSPTAVGCVPSNLAADDAGAGKQNYPCGTNYGCADGTYCNQKNECGAYCCTDQDCYTLTGQSGLNCVQTQFAGGVDAGASDAAAFPPGTFGVCQ